MEWNQAFPHTFVSSTQLTATVSASLIGSAGTASITVTSGGQTSAPASFTIGAPATGGVTVLDDITSNTAGVVNGTCSTPPSVTSFTTAAPYVYLYFDVNGASAGDSAQISFIQPNGTLYGAGTNTVSSVGTNGYVCFSQALAISGAQAASDPGTWTVQVFWDGSSTPLFSLNFTLTGARPRAAGPSITSVAPSSATAGSAPFTITVNGSGFVPGDVVLWNGTPLPTTYVNGNQLTATVSASLISLIGNSVDYRFERRWPLVYSEWDLGIGRRNHGLQRARSELVVLVSHCRQPPGHVRHRGDEVPSDLRSAHSSTPSMARRSAISQPNYAEFINSLTKAG